MSYAKHEWVAPQGTNLNRFLKENETETSVDLIQDPSLANSPTPFNAEWMNEMEQGIEYAHELIAAEAQARAQGDIDALEAAKSYTNEAIESEWVAINGDTSGFNGTAVLQINFQAKLLSIHLNGEAYGYGPPSAVINFHADELEDVAFKDIGQGYNAAVQAIPAINRGYIAGIIWGRIQKNGPSLSVEINVFNEQWSVTGCNIMLPFESGYYDSYGGEPVSGVLDNFQ